MPLRTAIWLASGSAARRRACRTSRSISRACRPGRDAGRSRKAVRRPDTFGAEPDAVPRAGRHAVAAVDGAALRQPGHRARPPPPLPRQRQELGPDRDAVHRAARPASSSASRSACSTMATGCCRCSIATARPGEKWNGDDDTSAVRISSDAGRPGGHRRPRQQRLRAHVRVAARRRLAARPLPQPLGGQHLSRAGPPITAAPGRRRSRPCCPTTTPRSRSRGSRNGHLALVFNDDQRQGRRPSAASRSMTTSRTMCRPARRRRQGDGRTHARSGARRGRR